jgi:hypothetical protein
MGSNTSTETSYDMKLTECEATLLACTSNQLGDKIAFINRIGVLYNMPALYIDPNNYQKQLMFNKIRYGIINAASDVASLSIFGIKTELVQYEAKQSIYDQKNEDFINYVNEYLLKVYHFSKIKF